MSNPQDEQGFKVVDRRGNPETATPAPASDGSPVMGPGWEMREEKSERPLPPMDFTTFCLSLASSALIHMGLAPYPEGERAEKNVPLAKQTIDILAMLEEKTSGNLSAEEARLLSTLLYDLRLRFVESTRA
jgi:hypothetical protein